MAALATAASRQGGSASQLVTTCHFHELLVTAHQLATAYGSLPVACTALQVFNNTHLFYEARELATEETEDKFWIVKE